MLHFVAKMHQIEFWLGSAPDPTRGAYSGPKFHNWIKGGL